MLNPPSFKGFDNSAKVWVPQNSLEMAALKAIEWYKRSGYVSPLCGKNSMMEKEIDPKTGPKDRKLGDKWLDWNGTTTPAEADIDERLGTFLTLAAGCIILLIACLGFGWYLTKPRIDQVSPLLANIMEWSVFIVVALILILVVLEATLLLKFNISLLPYTWAERLLFLFLSKAIWLGQRLGISKDRVSNSFIKAHNLVVKGCVRRLNTDRLLILLPRCLRKEVRQQVIERANGLTIHIFTAKGGEDARQTIIQYKPSLILAIACERDLISGIRDVADKIPVLAIPNKRPEGPCKNTCLSLDAFEEAMKLIREYGKPVKHSSNSEWGVLCSRPAHLAIVKVITKGSSLSAV